jgi:UDP-glucose 4-epimerase
MKIMVAGGAGYIGSIATEHLIQAGHQVTVVDNLSRGHAKAVHPDAAFYQGNIDDSAFLDKVFKEKSPEAVMHFCASSLVGESVHEPIRYFQNNIAAGCVLLDVMKRHGASYIIFSSTAAIFGAPDRQPIDEETPKNPTNPYGRTKLYFENLLADCDTAFGLKSVCLRYFNAAGATAERGEDHRPESHLIPCILDAVRGRTAAINVFGSDYPTPDGTCVRDYVHVSDLAQAHILALESLIEEGKSNRYNLGNGHGYSVMQVIEAVERVTGNKVPVKMGDRRAGDPAVLVASSEKIASSLGWKPQHASLDHIIASAWNWMQQHPDGYED